MSRKHILPGELVAYYKVMRENAYLAVTGIVVGVDYTRDLLHMGCEARVKVLWSDNRAGLERLSLMCDCELFQLQEL